MTSTSRVARKIVAAEFGAVSSTLRIPLAARAFGDSLFPDMTVGDRHAASVMAALGDDGRSWLSDWSTVYGMLARTRVFRTLAQSFFANRPRAQGVNLGCGLVDYFQWIDNGRNRWIDVDLDPVVSLRRTLMPSSSDRQRLFAADLTQPDWWSRLALGNKGTVFVMCEGLLMYLEPEQVKALLCEIATHAPAGTEIVFDAICWLAVGNAFWHPSVRCTGAEFRWGPRRVEELAAMHPRLRLLSEEPMMAGDETSYALLGSMLRFFTAIPFYSVYRLLVEGPRPLGRPPRDSRHR